MPWGGGGGGLGRRRDEKDVMMKIKLCREEKVEVGVLTVRDCITFIFILTFKQRIV